MKKHTALKQNIKNDTCVEFRHDIKAQTFPDWLIPLLVAIYFIVGQREQRKHFDEQYLITYRQDRGRIE